MDDLQLNEITEIVEQIEIEQKSAVYPDLTIGTALTVTAGSELVGGDKYMTTVGFGQTDNGTVGDSTTSIVQVDVGAKIHEYKPSVIVKGAEWNEIGVALALKQKIDIIKPKLINLRHNMFATIERIGWIGNAEDNRITGLLNHASVPVINAESNKFIEDFTADDIKDFIIQMFKEGFYRTNNTVYPNQIAINAGHLLTLSTSFITTANGGQISQLTNLLTVLKSTSGRDVLITAIPAGYGITAKNRTDATARAVVYFNDVTALDFYVPLMPEQRGVYKHMDLGVKTSYQMQVGCVRVKNAQAVTYFDYKCKVPKKK